MATRFRFTYLQYVKAGYASDNLPRFTFPSIVGRPILRAEEEAIGDVELKVYLLVWNLAYFCMLIMNIFVLLQDIMVGDEASALRRALEITYPLDNGIIRVR